MSNLWSEYYSPGSLSDALELLTQYTGRAKIIAGGTDIVNELKHNSTKRKYSIIDISRIKNLNYIDYCKETNQIVIGALVTHNDVVKSSLIINNLFSLAKACWSIGSPQIRNRGTLAGNIQTASPANDTIPPLMAADAIIMLESSRGIREVPIQDFFMGYRETAVSADELITRISFSLPNSNVKTNFVKVGLRKSQAISVVNGAAVLELVESKIITSRITFGAVGPTALRATKIEDFLNGRILSNETIDAAADFVGESIVPISDIRGSDRFRFELAKSCLDKLLKEILYGIENESFPSRPPTLSKIRGVNNEKSFNQTYHHTEDSTINTKINNREYSLTNGFGKTLLQLIREEAQLTGTKDGCNEGECGSCTVYLDGKAVYACLVPAPCAHNAEITTIEGLSKGDNLHVIQKSFIENDAIQCGYCTPGFIMSSSMLLEEIPNPSTKEIKYALSGNFCRCTGYYSIIKAIESAAETLNPSNENDGSDHV